MQLNELNFFLENLVTYEKAVPVAEWSCKFSQSDWKVAEWGWSGTLGLVVVGEVWVSSGRALVWSDIVLKQTGESWIWVTKKFARFLFVSDPFCDGGHVQVLFLLRSCVRLCWADIGGFRQRVIWSKSTWKEKENSFSNMDLIVQV